MAQIDLSKLTATQVKQLWDKWLLDLRRYQEIIDREVMGVVAKRMSDDVTRQLNRQESERDWKMAEEYDRYASFVERYVIARAPHFRAGFEKEDGWAATKDAETLFNTIKRQTQLRNDAERAEASQ